MPAKLIKLNPLITPQAYYQNHQQELDVIPDGTGLQILFKIAEEYYLIAGPRGGNVLTVNGGTIENKQAPFFAQLAEELEEETFGVIKVVYDMNEYQLILNNENKHALTILENQSILTYEPGKFAYVTFTAVCESLTLDELTTLANTLSPTAQYWNKMGNYLFSHVLKAPKNDVFVAYWKELVEERNSLIEELTANYNALVINKQLLIDPVAIFLCENITSALSKLHDVADYDALNKLFKHTVGRYSERSGYYVFKASELLSSAKGSEEPIKDVQDKIVVNKVFNADAVTLVFPVLLYSAKKTPISTLFDYQNPEEQLPAEPEPSLFSHKTSNAKTG